MRWLWLLLLAALPLSAQTPDSVRTYKVLAMRDSTVVWRTRVDTLRLTLPSGIPYGSWECTAPTNMGPFNLCIRSAGYWITKELAALKPLRGKLLLSQGSYARFQKNPPADKTYYSPKYKAWVDSLKPFVEAWKPYLDDGTLMGVQFIDDVGTMNWGGKAITKMQQDTMAMWWKELLPGIQTWTREKATGLQGYQWKYLDGSITQYNARYMGDVTKWRDSNVVAAKALKLSLILSLNSLNGGKVVPGCFHGGGDSLTCSMTPDELIKYGAVQLSTPEACAVANWKTDPGYAKQPGISDAYKVLSALAAQRVAVPC